MRMAVDDQLIISLLGELIKPAVAPFDAMAVTVQDGGMKIAEISAFKQGQPTVGRIAVPAHGDPSPLRGLVSKAVKIGGAVSAKEGDLCVGMFEKRALQIVFCTVRV